MTLGWAQRSMAATRENRRDACALEQVFFFAAPSRPAAVATLPPGPSATPAMELAFWQSIQASGNAANFQAYLDKYGDSGEFAALARNRIAELQNRQQAALAPISGTWCGRFLMGPRHYDATIRISGDRSAVVTIEYQKKNQRTVVRYPAKVERSRE